MFIIPGSDDRITDTISTLPTTRSGLTNEIKYVVNVANTPAPADIQKIPGAIIKLSLPRIFIFCRRDTFATWIISLLYQSKNTIANIAVLRADTKRVNLSDESDAIYPDINSSIVPSVYLYPL